MYRRALMCTVLGPRMYHGAAFCVPAHEAGVGGAGSDSDVGFDLHVFDLGVLGAGSKRFPKDKNHSISEPVSARLIRFHKSEHRLGSHLNAVCTTASRMPVLRVFLGSYA